MSGNQLGNNIEVVRIELLMYRGVRLTTTATKVTSFIWFFAPQEQTLTPLVFRVALRGHERRRSVFGCFLTNLAESSVSAPSHCSIKFTCMQRPILHKIYELVSRSYLCYGPGEVEQGAGDHVN